MFGLRVTFGTSALLLTDMQLSFKAHHQYSKESFSSFHPRMYIKTYNCQIFPVQLLITALEWFRNQKLPIRTNIGWSATLVALACDSFVMQPPSASDNCICIDIVAIWRSCTCWGGRRCDACRLLIFYAILHAAARGYERKNWAERHRRELSATIDDGWWRCVYTSEKKSRGWRRK